MGEGRAIKQLKRKLPLGTGQRFAALESSFQKGIHNPGALAASIGRKKYGKEKFQRMVAKGKRK